MKINQVMTKTVLEMLKTASDIEIREISIFADNEERNRAIKDISDDIKTNNFFIFFVRLKFLLLGLTILLC